MSKVHPLAIRLKAREDYVTGKGTIRQIAAAHGLPFLTVKAWGKQGHWTKARQRYEDRITSDPPSPSRPHPAATTIPTESPDSRTHAIQRLQDQMSALDNALDNAKTADDWHKLSAARERLFNMWRILADVPLPGSRKPSPTKATRLIEPVTPLDD